MSTICNVCGNGLPEPLYESPDGLSITTMNQLVTGSTRVYFCANCGHIQSSELPDLKDYYARQYEVSLGSGDDDQVYAVVGGRTVFRAEHQAAVLSSKIDWFPGCRVLDYGCAKAPTLKAVWAAHPDIDVFLFDVTDKYVPCWQRFPKLPSWSVHQPDPTWSGTLDVVLSFFALEHVSDLHAALANVKSLLKPGGTFYFIVPDVYANTADFVVADHINHFSPESLHTLLERDGFGDIEVDADAHDAALVVTARPAVGPRTKTTEDARRSKLGERCAAAQAMAEYWRDISQRIRDFEKELRATDVVAIYGAGFYGNFIASRLARLERVLCFVDQNPHLQGCDVRGKRVLPPAELPPEVTHVLVGLNPRKARSIIDSVAGWRSRKLTYLYL